MSISYPIQVNLPTSMDLSDPYGMNGSTPFDVGDIYIGSSQETVKGQMLVAEIRYSEATLVQLAAPNFKDEIKKQLVLELANEMLKNKMVEFTKQEDMRSGEVTFRARAYLTPDDKVRLIRGANK